eukprot:10445598-Alexandrium_andersonii.AAC.1
MSRRAPSGHEARTRRSAEALSRTRSQTPCVIGWCRHVPTCLALAVHEAATAAARGRCDSQNQEAT